MIITPDKWYIVNDESRQHFLHQAKYQFGSQCCVSENLNLADCLKYNSKTKVLNYRMTYNPQYCQCYEVYKMEDEMEHKIKLSCPECEDRVICDHDPILDHYYEDNRTKLEKEYFENRRKTFLETPIGKIAHQYIREVSLRSKFAPDLEALVPDECLSIEARRYLDELATELNNNVNMLNRKCEEIRYLLSIADTYEQKEAIYVRYGLLQKENDTMKALKAKLSK